ncbi:hypothetical protein BGW41_000297 [Actinomortierella wolfii]|nr:hypothetical protein BGW41_000297 [Actinomortierella wolfii]
MQSPFNRPVTRSVTKRLVRDTERAIEESLAWAANQSNNLPTRASGDSPTNQCSLVVHNTSSDHQTMTHSEAASAVGLDGTGYHSPASTLSGTASPSDSCSLLSVPTSSTPSNSSMSYSCLNSPTGEREMDDSLLRFHNIFQDMDTYDFDTDENHTKEPSWEAEVSNDSFTTLHLITDASAPDTLIAEYTYEPLSEKDTPAVAQLEHLIQFDGSPDAKHSLEIQCRTPYPIQGTPNRTTIQGLVAFILGVEPDKLMWLISFISPELHAELDAYVHALLEVLAQLEDSAFQMSLACQRNACIQLQAEIILKPSSIGAEWLYDIRHRMILQLRASSHHFQANATLSHKQPPPAKPEAVLKFSPPNILHPHQSPTPDTDATSMSYTYEIIQTLLDHLQKANDVLLMHKKFVQEAKAIVTMQKLHQLLKQNRQKGQAHRCTSSRLTRHPPLPPIGERATLHQLLQWHFEAQWPPWITLSRNNQDDNESNTTFNSATTINNNNFVRITPIEEFDCHGFFAKLDDYTATVSTKDLLDTWYECFHEAPPLPPAALLYYDALQRLQGALLKLREWSESMDLSSTTLMPQNDHHCHHHQPTPLELESQLQRMIYHLKKEMIFYVVIRDWRGYQPQLVAHMCQLLREQQQQNYMDNGHHNQYKRSIPSFVLWPHWQAKDYHVVVQSPSDSEGSKGLDVDEMQNPSLDEIEKLVEESITFLQQQQQ